MSENWKKKSFFHSPNAPRQPQSISLRSLSYPPIDATNPWMTHHCTKVPFENYMFICGLFLKLCRITANIFESGPRPTPWKCYNNVSFHIFQYLYLLFSDDELISLDEWVFNTEAHPLPIKGHNKFYRSSNDIDTGAIKVKKSDILAASADAVLLH